MSGVITPAFSLAMLQTFFHAGTYNRGYTSVEIALTRRVPVSNAGLNQLDEPIGGGYRRSAPIPLSNAAWQINGAGQIFNATPVSWPLDCTVSWGTIQGWAVIGRHPTAPPVLAIGELVQPVRFVPGMRPRLPAGSITMGLFD